MEDQAGTSCAASPARTRRQVPLLQRGKLIDRVFSPLLSMFLLGLEPLSQMAVPTCDPRGPSA